VFSLFIIKSNDLAFFSFWDQRSHVVQFRVKRIKFLDSKLGPTIALLLKKGVIASFRDVDPYSGAIKVRSTRSTRLCPRICKTQFLNTSFLLLLNSSISQKIFWDLDITVKIIFFFIYHLNFIEK